MMKPSTFGFLVVRGVRNLGKHWAMTIACIASLSVCMTLNIFASLIEVNVDSMVNYLGSQNEMVVYVDPEADDATIQSVGERITATPGVSRVQYMSKADVLNQYRGYMADYAVLLDEFENDNPFKANYRVSLADLSQMQTMSQNFQSIPGVYSVTAPIEMTKTFVEVQRAVTKVGQIVILVLMAVSIITVGSTIRLSVFARRREIEIMKYVGATNHLVTLPFFCGGPDHGPDLWCHHLGSRYLRLCLHRAGLQHAGRVVAAAHGHRHGACGCRLAHHPDVQSGRWCAGGCAGQHVLHPQTSECVSERSLLCETSKTLCGLPPAPHVYPHPRKARPRAQPGHARRQPVSGSGLPAAERFGLPGHGGYQYVQPAEQAG